MGSLVTVLWSLDAKHLIIGSAFVHFGEVMIGRVLVADVEVAEGEQAFAKACACRELSSGSLYLYARRTI